MLWIVVAVFITLIIIMTVQKRDNGFAIQQTTANQDRFIRENGITKSVDYNWTDFLNEHYYRFIADDNAQKIYISSGVNGTELEEIPYEQIIGFEVFEDSQVVGGIKRAIVGGVLAGAAGAIVGSQTANKKAVSSMQAVIYRKNVSMPQFTFYFIDRTTKVTESKYISAKDFTNKVNAVIKAIIAKVEQQEATRSQEDKSPDQSASNDNVAEKQKILKNVYDDGLISTEEYEEKRKEILNSL